MLQVEFKIILGGISLRKFLCIFIVMALAFSLLGFNASANSTDIKNNTKENENYVVSEGDIIKLWLEKTDDELKELGYSDSEIAEIRSYNFEEMFLERASLPENTLKIYGYSDSQIETLKAYEGETITSDSVTLAATSDMSVSFSKNTSTSTNKAVFVNAAWNWNIIPMIKLRDIFVVTWQGVNSSGYTVDLTPTIRQGTIRYHRLTTGVHDHNSVVYGTFDSIKKAVSFNITMTKSDNYYWAKSGSVILKFVPPSNGSISYINLGAGYGHSTISVTPSYSVAPGLSVSFSPSLTVKRTGSRTGRVTSTGAVTNY